MGKGEWRLINGYILETALLFSEAAQSYLEGMQYLTQEKWPRQYFKCLLGVIRTSPENGHFIKEAESFLEHNPTNTNRCLFLAAKSSITSDKRKKLDLLLESLKHFDQEYNDRDLVKVF